MPHIERLNVDGNWQTIEDTLHNRDPKSKSNPAKRAHQMLTDWADIKGIGQAREVADQAGEVCSKGKPKKRKISAYNEPKFGPLASY